MVRAQALRIPLAQDCVVQAITAQREVSASRRCNARLVASGPLLVCLTPLAAALVTLVTTALLPAQVKQRSDAMVQVYSAPLVPHCLSW